MFLLMSLLLVSQGVVPTSDSRWDFPDVLIEDSLGPVVFAADYNYTTGDIYVAAGVDSGFYLGDYPGIVIFRSQDHGLTWEEWNSKLFMTGDMKGIDLVATRDDTLYVSAHASNTAGTEDHIEYYKFYEGGNQYLNHEATAGTAEFLSPTLVRDDFEPFHLYRAFILNIDGGSDSIFVYKSTDRGASWSLIERRYTLDGYYCDCDLTISDSTLYLTYSNTDAAVKGVRTRPYRDRGNIHPPTTIIIHSTADTINADIVYPRIGATTTLPDNGQLVYTLFSKRNTGTERWDLLYKHSVDGGANWSTDIDTIIQGSTAGVISDIRGYEVAPNQYMNITYCVLHVLGDPIPLPLYNNYWRWSSEGAPTNWHDTTDVSGGLFGSIPEIVYSPGASGTGSGVVYNDAMGNLYFDAPWYSGIAENSKENEDKIRSEIVLPGSVVKLSSAGATVYDIAGREIAKLTGDSWDLKDVKGEKVNCGIYFIVNEKTGERVKVSIPIK
ncbi:hypothetical protein JW879_07365 [candidate division WOR-3 bacterium]|nr:hypothetical protein [candidate division WOR-3 bacterium]